MDGNEQSERNDRINRLELAKKEGVQTYPSTLAWRRKEILEVIETFDSLEKKATPISIAGRIMGIRLHGGLCFADIADASGKIQLYIKKEHIGDAAFEKFSALIDRGDFCAAKGVCVKTKRGELSVLASDWQLLTKSLRPLPEKWHGLTNIETRFRKRELDLLSNPDAKRIAHLRTSLVSLIRDFLSKKDFIEVETPILQSIAGGAIAKPFVTHHEALSQDMFLRIAPELYLKRLIVGGYEKIFEVAKCFRNEGVDTWHNPEFTQVELYWAYADYKNLMSLSEQLLKQVQKQLFGGKHITFNNSDPIDFSKPFARVTYAEIVKLHTGIDPFAASVDELTAFLASKNKQPDPTWGKGKIIDEIFKIAVRPLCIQPTFITAYPAELSPLAKRNAKDSKIVDQFQLLAGGMEVIKAFSECNDPQDQQERFLEQEKLKQQGDEEAHASDQEFIEALEYGMPPTAGLGMGIDRLMMLLANTQNIKEVILFPTLRSK